MARIKPGKAYELWLAERGRLIDALDAASRAYSDAMFAKERAQKEYERHELYREDPTMWANGERIAADGQLLAGFKAYSCAVCGASGYSADGSCGRCAEDSAPRTTMLNIYQTM